MERYICRESGRFRETRAESNGICLFIERLREFKARSLQTSPIDTMIM